MIFDWHFILGLTGGLLALGAIIPYIRDILHGTTRPNTISYLLWVILLSISMFAQISAGASWSIVLILGDLIGTSIILVMCFMGYGYKKYGILEWVCLALASAAIISWQITDLPVLAILLAVLADAMAAIPTLLKTYRDPWSEFPTTWLIISLGASFAILSTTTLDPANLIYPVYIFLMNGLIGFIALFGRRTNGKLAEEVIKI